MGKPISEKQTDIFDSGPNSNPAIPFQIHTVWGASSYWEYSDITHLRHQTGIEDKGRSMTTEV